MELSKKKFKVYRTADAADFKTTIAPAQANDQLELDEIFTFYTMKLNHIRIWIALTYLCYADFLHRLNICKFVYGKDVRHLSRLLD